MRKKLSLFGVFLLLTVGLGANLDSCSPAKYCKEYYADSKDRSQCTTYCAEHPDLKSVRNLVRACQAGQAIYLYGPHATADEASTTCDTDFKDNEEAIKQACRLGASREQRRTLKGRKDNGSSGDRETGNSR